MSDELRLRRMEVSDLGFADSLRKMVGWNQTLQDWHRLLNLEPDGCFIAEWGDRPVGTATTTCYGTVLAWIGMVLVHSDFRGHGIGKALLKHCLNYLNQHGIHCIKLDATPLGKKVYDRLGFRDEWTLTRWEIASFSKISHSKHKKIRAFKEADWPQLLEMDAKIFGVLRHNLLKELVRQSYQVLVFENVSHAISGYGMLRCGSHADYLGPVISENPIEGCLLLDQLLSKTEKKTLFCDIPDQNADAINFVKQIGFFQQRPLIRMFLGENKFPGVPICQLAIADPAIG